MRTDLLGFADDGRESGILLLGRHGRMGTVAARKESKNGRAFEQR